MLRLRNNKCKAVGQRPMHAHQLSLEMAVLFLGYKRFTKLTSTKVYLSFPSWSSSLEKLETAEIN